MILLIYLCCTLPPHFYYELLLLPNTHLWLANNLYSKLLCTALTYYQCYKHYQFIRSSINTLQFSLKKAGIFLLEVVAFIKAVGVVEGSNSLTTKSVESTALTLQSVDYIHGGYGLSLGVLGVGDGITDDILQEHL